MQVASDTPIPPNGVDRLQRRAFAERVAKRIAERDDPASIIVGIYGAWGEGKSSVLNFIEGYLANDFTDSVITMKFNPWRFTNESALIESFFLSLAEAMGGSIKKMREEIGAWLKKYGGALAPPISIAGVSIDGKQIATAGSILSSVDLEDYRRRVEDLLKQEGKRVVVFIDDMDRLDKLEVRLLFKLVKLTADFDYVSYVLSFDPEIISGMLEEQYPGDVPNPGKRFLEKIVQVPLRLPKADPIVLRRLCLEQVDAVLSTTEIELTEEEANRFAYLFSQGFSSTLTTPRLAKLYSNRLLFSLPLVIGEVNVVDFMLIEAVAIFYPDLHSSISNAPEVYLTYGEGQNEQTAWTNERTGAVKSFSPKQQAEAKRLLGALFPRTEDQGYGGGWEANWAKEKRLCSRTYFDRYFYYSIPTNDFADSDVKRIVLAAASKEPSDVAELIQSLVTIVNAERLIQKLSVQSDEMSGVVAACLAKALALSADKFPPTRTDWVTIRRRAVWLIRDLITGIEDDANRATSAQELVAMTTSISLVAEFTLSLVREPDKEDQRPLTKEGEDLLVEATTQRFQDLASEDHPLWEGAGEDTHTVLWAWKKWDPGKQKAYVEDQLAKNAENAISLLDSYTGIAWGGELGLPFKDDFDAKDYERLSTIAEVDRIYNSVLEQYPDLQNNARYDGLEMTCSPKTLPL